MDFFALVIVASLIGLAYYFLRPADLKRGKLPPGPYPFPVVGNIFQLGDKPNRSFYKLSQTYGPLMSLRLGSLRTVVVSSPEMAKEVLQRYDHVFSHRFSASAWEAYDHHAISVALMPAGNRWRLMRKVFREVMLATPRLEASQGVREEMIKNLRDYLHESSVHERLVNIGATSFITTLNLTAVTLFSGQVISYDANASQEFKENFDGITSITGVPNLSDYFPIIKPFDLQGIKRKAEFYLGRMLKMFDDIINERLKARRTSPASRKNDMLDTLLDFSEDEENELSMNDLKHVLVDLFIAGADTSASTTEWAMTEFLRHPEKLAKAKQELRTVVGDRKQVQESDIPKLVYMEAVIKEVFRLHPAGPFLIPRKSEEDVEIGGYLIPKDTQIFVNVWAIGRNKSVWSNPESFEPERFLSNNIDYKGQDFELLPFGSGRRMCPGVPLAQRMLHMMVATFIHNIDWKLEPGMTPQQVDTSEKFGLAMHKADSLKAIPVKG